MPLINGMSLGKCY